MISLISTTRLGPTKSKKEKLIFEYMMNLVIVQLPVRWLWRSVSALERRILRSQVLLLLGTLDCFSLSHPPSKKKRKYFVQKVISIHTVSDVSPFRL